RSSVLCDRCQGGLHCLRRQSPGRAGGIPGHSDSESCPTSDSASNIRRTVALTTHVAAACSQSTEAVKPVKSSLTPEKIYRLLNEEIAPRFTEFARCRSTAQLMASPVYRALETAMRTVLETPEGGDFTAGPAPPRDRYRFLAWN